MPGGFSAEAEHFVYNRDAVAGRRRVSARPVRSRVLALEKGGAVKRSILVMSSLVILCVGNTEAVRAQGNRGRGNSVYDAARNGDIEALRQHVAQGANLNQADGFGYTPLKCAIESGHTEAVKVLLEGKANPNVKDGMGRAALIDASLRGQIEIVEMLLAKGADTAVQDGQGNTALHVAAQMGHQPVVEALVKAGADVNAEDKARRTPLTIANQRRQTAIADYLRQNGATEPEIQYGAYDDGYGPMTTGQGPAATGPATYVAAPGEADILSDPNAIRERIKAFEGLTQILAGFDANSSSEQRGWAQRRYDNRITLVRAVQRQFELEITLVKTTAEQEKAEETIKAVDELTAVRKRRYDLIGDDLREARRAAQQSQVGQTGQMGYGRGRGRSSGRGRSGYQQSMVDGASGPYGGTRTSTRPSSRRRPEPNEPPIDQMTQTQVQAWSNVMDMDKRGLLESVHDGDMAEFGGLWQVADQEEAKKTVAVIEGLMLAHQGRVDAVIKKMEAEDERLARLEERYGERGPGTSRSRRGGYPQQQGGQAGSTGRRRYR